MTTPGDPQGTRKDWLPRERSSRQIKQHMFLHIFVFVFKKKKKKKKDEKVLI